MALVASSTGRTPCSPAARAVLARRAHRSLEVEEQQKFCSNIFFKML
jgi:hypothetical protein